MFWPEGNAEKNRVAGMLERCGGNIFSACHSKRSTGRELSCFDNRKGKIAATLTGNINFIKHLI